MLRFRRVARREAVALAFSLVACVAFAGIAGSTATTRSQAKPLSLSARLAPADGAAGDTFPFSVAIAGRTTVVGAIPSIDVGAAATLGSAYVFAEGSGGWSSEPGAAKLTASDGSPGDLFGYAVAVSGRTVVVGAPRVPHGPAAIYVFTEPATGWSGTLHQAAKLSASDGATLGFSVAVSGRTVFATAVAKRESNGSIGAVYVFREPARGWSGTVHEVARLIGPARASVGSVAVSGRTVFAGGDAVRVWSEPVRGWSGIRQSNVKLVPSVRLTAGALGSVAASGRTVVAGDPLTAAPNGATGQAYVFTEPRRGWSGTVRESAKLIAADGGSFLAGGNGFATFVAISGHEILASTVPLQAHDCPCQGFAYLFSEPIHGWSGTRAANHSISYVTNNPQITLDRNNAVIAATGFAAVYSLLAQPRIAH